MTPLSEFFTTGLSDKWNCGKSQRRKLGAVAAGIKEESAYYESLHEVPLIANLIDRKRLYEMNRVISDTAEIRNHPIEGGGPNKGRRLFLAWTRLFSSAQREGFFVHFQELRLYALGERVKPILFGDVLVVCRKAAHQNDVGAFCGACL